MPSVSQNAEILGISPARVRKLLCEGALAFQMQRRLRVAYFGYASEAYSEQMDGGGDANQNRLAPRPPKRRRGRAGRMQST